MKLQANHAGQRQLGTATRKYHTGFIKVRIPMRYTVTMTE